MFRIRHSSTIALATAILLISACGGGGEDSAGSADSATVASEPPDGGDSASLDTGNAGSEPSVIDAVDISLPDGSVEILEDGGLDLICDTLPPIDVVSGIVGESLTTVTDLSQPALEGMVSQKCEVTGDGVSLAIFERMDSETAKLIVETAGEGPVSFDADPDLAGAKGVVNGVMIERDGVIWYATVVRMDWVASIDNPLAYETSGELLRAWLAVN